ncbi:ABC transporter permease [Chryseosolibacter indicus]|uniref:ABC transporter permease n=1 Tax=Chryseosolibacter indicus TaxID=2782351 RepID=A0ABS5VRS9_9BACT|nr:ABC transporter permease [Chryseosolibacter indicus]MBT1703535.1 ABC transporter permease [Chryseosolibacter indicus]
MVKNYLIIALRFFERQRGFSIINVCGLTIGITCSLLILLYIQDELRFDKFHPDADRIYRLAFAEKFQGNVNKTTLTGFPVATALQQKPEVESTLRMANWATFPVRFESKAYTEKYLLLADSNFFKFFDFQLIEGNPDSVLDGDRKIVITESAAKRIFDYKGKGDKSPIGKILNIAQGYTVEVSGIAKDPPLNSHFHFTLILSLETWEHLEPSSWLSTKVLTYFKLKPSVDEQHALEEILHALQTELDKALTLLRSTNLLEYQKRGSELYYFIQPLTDIHLHSSLNDEIETNSNSRYVYLFSAIAIFIMLLACINFMNLTTAQSATRAKEVSVKKTIGAQNNRLVAQFLFESYFFVVLAVIFAFALLLITLVPFNYFTGKALSFSSLFSIPFLAGIMCFTFVTGLIAGSYPAFYLTQFSPVEVLKGNLRAKTRSYGIRNVLVVFQFFISSGLIVATTVVYTQLQYLKNADVGFDKQNIINLLHTRNLGNNAVAFKEELLKQEFVVSASYCNRLPPNLDWEAIFRKEGLDKDFSLAVYEMDYDHLKTMGYKLVSGRFFDPDANDSLSLIINETAARRMHIQAFENPKVFTTYDQPLGKDRKVIGIIKDFNFKSLREDIQPLAIVLGFQPNWEMAIRVKGEPEKVVHKIRDIYKKFALDAPFEYALVEDSFDNKHNVEKRVGLLFILFTCLAIFIACLGLFGLASFTAEQQRKEIGIRKVLGATEQNIILLLNKEFLKLVLIANLIAWPIIGWLMWIWLNQYAYHTVIPWSAFALSTFVTFFIAFISVSVKALKAASGNPVDSLRNE